MAKTIRLTPPQIELLTDIATKPAMYVTRFSTWDRTATALITRGLAVRSPGYAGGRQCEITITQAGRDEAARRGITLPARHPGSDRCEHGTQFLNECEQCPNGCPVIQDARTAGGEGGN